MVWAIKCCQAFLHFYKFHLAFWGQKRYNRKTYRGGFILGSGQGVQAYDGLIFVVVLPKSQKIQINMQVRNTLSPYGKPVGIVREPDVL